MITKLIVSSDDEPIIGYEGMGQIFNPFTKEYEFGWVRVNRLATKEEYEQFCKERNLSTSIIRETPYYWEVETDIVFGGECQSSPRHQ
jgi:hypothetical protein